MREILFRGKPTERFADYPTLRPDLFRDGWVYGSLVVCEDRYYICTHAECSNRTIISNAHGTMIEVIPETVGEFTGLHDIHGKRIFEGDVHGIPHWVVTYAADVNESLGMNAGWYVQRDNFESWMGLECHDQNNIIGNIHDNPELLKRRMKNAI